MTTMADEEKRQDTSVVAEERKEDSVSLSLLPSGVLALPRLSC